MDTFVLRIWSPGESAGDAAAPDGMRGTVQHVGTGRSGVFRSDAQLLGLIAALRRQADEERGFASAGYPVAGETGRETEGVVHRPRPGSVRIRRPKEQHP